MYVMFLRTKNQPQVFMHRVFLRPPRVMDVRAFGSRMSTGKTICSFTPSDGVKVLGPGRLPGYLPGRPQDIPPKHFTSPCCNAAMAVHDSTRSHCRLHHCHGLFKLMLLERASKEIFEPSRAFPEFSPLTTAGGTSFFRSGSGEGLSELVMEFPAVLRVLQRRVLQSVLLTAIWKGNKRVLRKGA